MRLRNNVATLKQPEPYATTDDLLRTVTSHQKELRWLALFLTAEETLADACLAPGSLSVIPHRHVFLSWIDHWARHALILTAVKVQEAAIKESAVAYALRPCRHFGHPPLTGPQFIALQNLPREAVRRIDVICRFALMMRGVENYCSHQSALLLNVSRSAFNAAYCAGLDLITLLNAETVVASG